MKKMGIAKSVVKHVVPIVLALCGCMEERASGPGIATGSAQLRVVHLSPDAPAVSVFVDQGPTPAFTGLEFHDGSSYADLPAGLHDFDVAPAAGTIADAVLRVREVRLEEMSSYTVVAYDTTTASVKSLLLEDDYEGIADGQARIRAAHIAVGVGQVDIYALEASGEPQMLYENVNFGVAGAFIDIPARAFTVGIDVDNDRSADLIFDVPSIEEDTLLNLFATTDTEGNVVLLAQFPRGDTLRIDPRGFNPPMRDPARVRVLHLSPDAPPVDVFVDEARAITGLRFPEGTPYTMLEAGSYDFAVSATGTPASQAVIELPQTELAENTAYTVVAYDRLASITPLALVDDLSVTSSGTIRIRAIHAASGVGQVDILNIPGRGTPTPLYENVDFGVASAYAELPAGQYTIGLDVNNDHIADAVFALPALPAGTIANVFAVHDGLNVFLLAQFADGTTARIDRRHP